jgi:hypothetical protein
MTEIHTRPRSGLVESPVPGRLARRVREAGRGNPPAETRQGAPVRPHLVWNRRHLEYVLAQYVGHYNAARPHRGIDLDVPVPPTAEPTPPEIREIRRIERADVLGGLVHEYHRAA